MSATSMSWCARRPCGCRTRRFEEAGRRNIPVILRGELLAELMADKAGRGHCRRARQDDDDLDARSRARPRRTGSDGRHRRPFRGFRQSRPRRPQRAPGRRSGRKRSLVPLVASVPRDRHQYRPRAPRELRHLRRAHASLCEVRRVSSGRRRGDSLHRRPAPHGDGRNPRGACRVLRHRQSAGDDRRDRHHARRLWIEGNSGTARCRRP